ncbi:MAG: beta-ketoacyl synthase N-terminal-like domain-containing protein [Acutalibacteraceae bacterium]|nr:beta-ketoacyl synthase N-terminal-like domain-containing protein [Acutalibacteraceae bacterium]
MYSKILGTGSYLPQNVRTNSDLEKMVDTSNEWIIERTGIRERRIASEKETTSYMGYQAALKAIEASGLTAQDIDLILVGTSTAEYAFPTTACQIQNLLGCRAVPAFDFVAACSGFVYGLSIADQYIRCGTCRNVLVIGVDIVSNTCNQDDRTTIILFGDGAGAAVVSA